MVGSCAHSLVQKRKVIIVTYERIEKAVNEDLLGQRKRLEERCPVSGGRGVRMLAISELA